MQTLPRRFSKFGTQIWHYVLASVAFFIIITLYRPSALVGFLDMGRGLFGFNVCIISSIVLVTLVLSRLVFYFLRFFTCRSWWHYLAWCILEVLAASLFVALYLTLMLKGAMSYFDVLGFSTLWCFLILSIPYAILTLSFYVIGMKEEQRDAPDDASLVRFLDVNKQLKLVLAPSALLYVSAEENYVRIHYMDGDRVKDYQLRASMTGIEPVMTKAGIFRCQRSYYVNPQHIKALRKDVGGSIVAELDCAGLSVPVSRNTYEELGKLI